MEVAVEFSVTIDRTPEAAEKLKASDQTLVGSTPAEAAAQLAADHRKWGEVARRIKLGLD